MSRKKVSTTIYITPEQAERLKLLHERTKVPISVYVREGIDMMLKHYEYVLPGQMSLDAAPLSSLPPVSAPGEDDDEEAPRPARSASSGGQRPAAPARPEESGPRPPPGAGSAVRHGAPKPTRSGEGGV
jgi:Ribbon-helix-helix domain